VVLRPWLYTIARNRCLTMLRGRVRQAGGELVEPPTEHLAAAVERRHDLRDLLRDLAGLPEEQRSALVLSEIGDMSHDEIADVLGCRRDKVKALVFQARSSLIASRQARETPCADIREQLANLRGGSLRRTELRRHVSECPGCREFRDQVRAQRRDLAVVLPVAPTIGLKSGVLGGALGASAAAPAATVGGAASATLAAKVLVVAAIAGGGTVAVEEVARHGERPARSPADHTSSAPAAAPVVTPLRGAPPSHLFGKGHAKAVPPGAAVKGARPAGEHAAKPKHAGKSAAAPGHARRAGAAGRGNSANAPGHLKAKGHGKPEKAAKPATPPNAAKPAKPEKAAKPGKASKPATGPRAEPGPTASKPSGAAKPSAAAQPVKAPKPSAAAQPVKAPKPPAAAQPVKALKPVKPPKISSAPTAGEPVPAPVAPPAAGSGKPPK
jgi:hypothetical protein